MTINKIIWIATLSLLGLSLLLFLFRLLFRKRLLSGIADDAAKQVFNFKEFLKMAYPSALLYSLLYLLFLIGLIVYYSHSADTASIDGIRNALENGPDSINAASWMPALICFFLGLWLTMHIVDMDCRSRNRPFALFLKALNTNTGASTWNYVILVSSFVILVFSIITLVSSHRYYICMPLFIAIFVAMLTNIFWGGSNDDWNVKKPSQSKWTPGDDNKHVKIKAGTQDSDGRTPEGKTPVELTFRWNLAKKWGINSDSSDTVKLTLYKEDWDEPDPQLRKKNPFYGISDDGTTMNWLFAIGQNIHQSATQVVGGPDDDQYQSEQDALDLIVQSAIDIADKYGLADFEVPELLLSFSQSDEIKYNEDQNSAPINKFNITDADGTQRLEYFRFAAETLYDREGDCDCKSVLAYRLLKTLGMDVKLIDICDKGASTPTHAAIMLKDDTNRYPKCTKYPEYTYCEATSNGWRIGNIPEDFDPLSIGILA